MKLIAACAFGLEALVKRELIALGYEPRVEQPGRVSFQGDWEAVSHANLWLRTADRVLLEVLQFPVPDFDALFDTTREFDWTCYLPRDAAFPVVGKSRNSTLSSVPAVQRTVKKGVVESLRQHYGVQELPETGANYKIQVAILDDLATLTIDTTGPSLHKRGYRKLVAAAPLKETLAAALVQLSVWHPDRPLLDPFCGSGTIAIEAGLIGRQMAPGLSRQFAASDWPVISAATWNLAREQAIARQDPGRSLQILGSDRDEEVLGLARYHARQAGLGDAIEFRQQEFDQLHSRLEYGCLITNPPYGERLEDQYRLQGLYESIPAVMQRLPTWSLFLITNYPDFESLIQKQATRRRKLYNGRIECTYYQFLGPRPPRQPPTPVESSQGLTSPPTAVPSAVAPRAAEVHRESTPTARLPVQEPVNAPPDHRQALAASNPRAPRETKAAEGVSQKEPDHPPVQALFGQINDTDRRQAELFRSRLVKRARHLRRWPTRRGITCFRIYERDIPEIPLVVDRYEDHLHITEYERPHERDLARHGAWLDLMRQVAAEALNVAVENTHLKQRRKNQSGHQYERLDSKRELIPVHEGGLTFLVNLDDYVDTGLFLDHRLTRQRVREQAAGKRVLNLFAYTGSFSVYAAAGQARSVTTVDLSRNYLDWAERNFSANQLPTRPHQWIASDSIDYLDSIAAGGPQFELAIVDPPTYSNSKRTDDDWNVQLDYLPLLRKLRVVMATGGEVYFSTNFRRFKMDEAALPEFECREISQQTVPEDFRNRRIHRCWLLKAV